MSILFISNVFKKRILQAQFPVLTICFLMIGCKSFKDYTNQKVTLIENKSQKFTLDKNQFITDFFVNGKKGHFLFDLGATTSVINDETFIQAFKLSKENYYTSFKMKGANGVLIESKTFISDTISSDILRGSKKIFKTINIKGIKLECNKDIIEQTGIIGFDVLKTAAKPILLDFLSNQISVLDTNYPTIGYDKLEAKIPVNIGSKIIIPILLDGNSVDFLFDTGNNGGLSIMEKNNKISDSKQTSSIQTYIGSVDGFSIQNIKKYDNVKVLYNNLINENTKVSSYPNLISNSMGMSFIKHFNWILDFNTGDIYIKKISEFDSTTETITKVYYFKAASLNGKLVVAYKDNASLLNYKLSDEIISINHQKVTSENICQMQELLNNTQDWNTLELEIIPAKN